MTRNKKEQTRAGAARVAEHHRKAKEDYAAGEPNREGMDRADALRRESWRKPATSPKANS